MFPPNKLLVVSDGNELEFVNSVKADKGKEINHRYRYLISKTKLAYIVLFSENELRNYLKNNIFMAI